MAPSRRHYRPSSKPLATAWALHLDAVMRERDLSQTNVFELVREELGYGAKSRSALLGVFSDEPPDERQAEALRRHFGEPSVGPTQTTPAELSLHERAVLAAERQAAAAERQAAATEALVAMFAGRAPDPSVVEAMQAWGQAALARTQSPALQAAPTPTTER